MQNKVVIAKRIYIKAAWKFYDENGDNVDSRIFPLLNAIHESGKLTIAAGDLGTASSTHLTLPTNYAVLVSVLAVSLIRKLLDIPSTTNSCQRLYDPTHVSILL